MSKIRLLSVSPYLNLFLRVKQQAGLFSIKERAELTVLPQWAVAGESKEVRMDLGDRKMTQLKIKHPSGLGVQSSLGG